MPDPTNESSIENSIGSILGDIKKKAKILVEVNVFDHNFVLTSPDTVKESKLNEKRDNNELTLEEHQLKMVAMYLVKIDDKDFSECEKIGDIPRDEYVEKLLSDLRNGTLIGALYVATGDVKKREMDNIVKNVKAEGLKAFYAQMKKSMEELDKEIKVEEPPVDENKE